MVKHGAEGMKEISELLRAFQEMVNYAIKRGLEKGYSLKKIPVRGEYVNQLNSLELDDCDCNDNSNDGNDKDKWKRRLKKLFAIGACGLLLGFSLSYIIGKGIEEGKKVEETDHKVIEISPPPVLGEEKVEKILKPYVTPRIEKGKEIKEIQDFSLLLEKGIIEKCNKLPELKEYYPSEELFKIPKLIQIIDIITGKEDFTGTWDLDYMLKSKIFEISLNYEYPHSNPTSVYKAKIIGDDIYLFRISKDKGEKVGFKMKIETYKKYRDLIKKEIAIDEKKGERDIFKIIDKMVELYEEGKDLEKDVNIKVVGWEDFEIDLNKAVYPPKEMRKLIREKFRELGPRRVDLVSLQPIENQKMYFDYNGAYRMTNFIEVNYTDFFVEEFVEKDKVIDYNYKGRCYSLEKFEKAFLQDFSKLGYFKLENGKFVPTQKFYNIAKNDTKKLLEDVIVTIEKKIEHNPSKAHEEYRKRKMSNPIELYEAGVGTCGTYSDSFKQAWKVLQKYEPELNKIRVESIPGSSMDRHCHVYNMIAYFLNENEAVTTFVDLTWDDDGIYLDDLGVAKYHYLY